MSVRITEHERNTAEAPGQINRSSYQRALAPGKTKLTSVSLVIPAYNDETTVGRLVNDADEMLREICEDYEIVVVNDGSKDQTLRVLERIAQRNRHVVLRNHEVNQGFGRTIKELYYSGRCEFVFSLPGDYQYAPKELVAMAEGLKDHDFVIGLRVKRNDPPRRKFQSAIYNSMLRLLYGNRHKDVNSIKLFRREILDRVKLESETAFVDAEFVIKAEKVGYKVVEIPIEHLPRLSQGASGGKVSVILETFKEMFTMRSTL